MSTLFQGVTISQLQIFVTAARTENFTTCAAQLFLTVPTVSRNILALEQELGVTLFVREKKRVRLTPSGESFYNSIKPILKRFELSVSKAVSIQQEKRTSLRVVDYQITQADYYLIPALNRFESKYPEVDVHVETGAGPTFFDALIGGKYEIAFASESLELQVRRAGFSTEVLCPGTACFVISNAHPLFDKPDLGIEDLRQDTIVTMSSEGTGYYMNEGGHYYEMVDIYFKHYGFAMDRIRYVNSAYAMDMELHRGRVVALLSTVYANESRKDLRAIPVSPELPYAANLGIDIIWNKANDNPYISRFLECARNAVKERALSQSVII